MTKALIHHIGKNGEHFYGENFIYIFPKSLKHIKEADWGDKLKVNYSTFGHMLMEVDWGGKPNYTSCGCPMANWKGLKTHNPNHMNESLLSEVDWGAHDLSVFLFLVNILYDHANNVKLLCTLILNRAIVIKNYFNSLDFMCQCGFSSWICSSGYSFSSDWDSLSYWPERGVCHSK